MGGGGVSHPPCCLQDVRSRLLWQIAKAAVESRKDWDQNAQGQRSTFYISTAVSKVLSSRISLFLSFVHTGLQQHWTALKCVRTAPSWKKKKRKNLSGGMFAQTEKLCFVIWFWLMVARRIRSEWRWLKKETVSKKLYTPCPALFI